MHLHLQSLEEDAESLASEQGLQTHPLLAKPTNIAVVAPWLPARIFLRTEVCPDDPLLEAPAGFLSGGCVHKSQHNKGVCVILTGDSLHGRQAGASVCRC